MQAVISAGYRRARQWVRPVRHRLTLIATALVTVALAIAALVMIAALHRVLLRNADSATEARAEQIAAQLQAGGVNGVDDALLVGGEDISAIQIVDATGRIRKSNAAHDTLAMAEPLAPGQRETRHDARIAREGGEFRATGLGTVSPDGPLTVFVGAAEGPINRTVILVAILCCLVFPVIVVAIAVLTYYSTGRALRPVAAIRERVEEISGGDLSRRVPVPASDDEVADLAVTMNDMLERIEVSRHRQLQFVNDASHELNSPLTTLVGLLDLAGTTRQPIDVATVTDVMLPDALRLQQLVADLLLLARADESGVPLRLGEVDLDDLVSSEVSRLSALSPVLVEAQVVTARIAGDEEKLARALRNIVDNAVRHAAGRVSIGMTRDAMRHTVSVTVVDDGPGIPDSDKSRVIERFVRLDGARSSSSAGSGLGLSITAEIISAHGGELTVADAVEGGAAVGFTLPVPEHHDLTDPDSA